jgi:ABC-type sugar transport system substrate-binding protein
MKKTFRKSRIAVFIALALVVSFLLIGCEGEGEEEKKQVTIAVFCPDGGNAYYQNKVYGYEIAAGFLAVEFPDYEVTVDLYNAGGYSNAMKQISQVEDAMTKGVDAICITACDGDALVPIIDEARSKGIPVINDGVWVNTETEMLISENSYRVGVHSANYIVRELNGKGDVALLYGPAAATLFTERARGLAETFAKYPDINIIADQYHEITIMEGRRIMEDWIAAHGKEVDAVWATNSMSLTGACDAMADAGWDPDEFLICGIDLSDVSIDYMEDGWIDALMPAQPIKGARIALVNAFYAAIGRDVPDLIYEGDDYMIPAEEFPHFDTSDAVAPEGWQPDWKS